MFFYHFSAREKPSSSAPGFYTPKKSDGCLPDPAWCCHRSIIPVFFPAIAGTFTGKTVALFICCISGDVQHCLTVDLECDRAVKRDGDIMARDNLNDIFVVYMLALEDGREDGESFDLAASVEYKQ